MGEWWMWTGFFSIVLVLLWIDIRFVGGGKAHKVSLKEAGIWSLIWVSVALLFNLAIWLWLDHSAGREIANQKGLEFLTGYLIEKALAVDNVFVWLMLFGYFAIPAELQRRVLLYGVLGAIVMRAGMVFAGSWLIEQFHWILYLFGAFLLLTGAKMLWAADKEPDLENNALLGWMRRRFKVTETLEGEKFFVWRDGVRYATPLLLILVLVEVSDLIFAVDSIPAIFAVTTDPFIVLTSNIFAIMGLRAMYFLLAGVTGFHNEIEDLIQSDQWGPGYRPTVMTYLNVKKARIKGLELTGWFDVLDNVQLTGNLTLLDSEDKSTGDDLAKTPDHTGNIGLDWKASDVVSANLAWQYVGSQVIKVPARNAQAFTSKHYQTLDVNTKWTVTPALDFKLGITNLTNTQRDEVATDADFILEGRTVYAGVDYKL